MQFLNKYLIKSRSIKYYSFKIRSELSNAYVNQIDKIFSNILMRFNYALRTSNQRKNLKFFVRKSERKNAPKAWKLWAMESSKGE